MLVFSTIYFWRAMGSFGILAMFLCTGAIYASVAINNQVKTLDQKRRPLLDQKSKIVSDAVLSAKNIKFSAWEYLIKDSLDKVRQEDNGLLLNNFTLQGVSSSIVAIIPCLIGLLCIAYIKLFLKKDISVPSIYVILVYLNSLKKMMLCSNYAFIEINSSLISFKRISLFLKIKDYREGVDLGRRRSDEKYSKQSSVAVRMSGCTMSWENGFYRKKLEALLKKNNVKRKQKSDTELVFNQCLKNIELSVDKGKFVAIIGQVGAGKSSLLRTMLGDLQIMKGDFEVNGSVAYIPQEAFLINDTLRNNILFGKEYDEDKYRKIIKISQLKPDLKMLPEEDMTMIGERGLNL